MKENALEYVYKNSFDSIYLSSLLDICLIRIEISKVSSCIRVYNKWEGGSLRRIEVHTFNGGSWPREWSSLVLFLMSVFVWGE